MSDSNRFVALVLLVTVWFVALSHRIGDIYEKVNRIELRPDQWRWSDEREV